MYCLVKLYLGAASVSNDFISSGYMVHYTSLSDHAHPMTNDVAEIYTYTCRYHSNETYKLVR